MWFYYLSMKHLVDLINEGVFDVYKSPEQVVDKISTQDILSKCKGNFKALYLKDGSAKITGKLIISGDAMGLYIKCSNFKGHLIIENCPELKSLEWSFLNKLYIFDGSITINNCPKLESLKGISDMIKGDLTVTNCKRIKDLANCDSVFGDVMWHNNGKKLTHDQIKDATHCLGQVLLEGLDEEEIIDESLNNPWLQKLARQLKNYSSHTDWYNKETKSTLQDVLGDKGLFDKVDSDDIDVYDMKNAGDKKAVLKLMFNTYSSSNGEAKTFNRLLVFDCDADEFICGFSCESWKHKNRGETNPFKVSQQFDIPTKSKTGKVKEKLEGINDIKRYIESLYNYKIIAISYSDEHGFDKRWAITKSRNDARQGMITPGDAEQYKKIAKENILRYKKILAENRVKGNTTEYEEVAKKVGDILERANKMSMDVIKHPEKYSFFDMSHIFDQIRDSEHYDKGKVYGTNGLLIKYKSFINKYMDIRKNTGYGDPANQLASLNKQKESLLQYIDKIDANLKKYGF